MPVSLFGQDEVWEEWNNNYKEISLTKLLKLEDNYADSIEANEDPGMQFYFRSDAYRFDVVYLNNWRKISEEKRNAIETAFKVNGLDSKYIEIINEEVEFKTDSGIFWFPIQDQLVRPLKEEGSLNSTVHLYTLFLNLHNVDSYFNLFIISEFQVKF